MPSSVTREFDVVIFGSTGYTGEYVVEELAKVLKGTDKKWAVAGRNKEKVKGSLEKVQQYLEDGINIKNIPIIEADVSNESSIDEMCKRTKLVLNCVGPYKLYGEVVVAACVENGTHHVDLSGEIRYLEGMQAKYFNPAKDNNTYIVGPCGFDCLPSDYGTALLKKKFPGDLNSVEIYAEILSGPSGRSTNIGTWSSAVNSVADHAVEWKITRAVKAIFDKKLPFSNFRSPFRLPLFYNSEVESWCSLFLGPDERVVKRTQMFDYQFLNERPVHAKVYMKLKSVWTAFYSIYFIIPAILSFFSFGRNLVTKYPAFFTAGIFSSKGPTREQVEEGKTKFTLLASGWKDKLPDPTDQHTERPDKKMKLVISGPEPAYALTSICMVHSGLTILEETDKLPLNGGVLTPGAAFANTTLRERLQKRGITFEFTE